MDEQTSSNIYYISSIQMVKYPAWDGIFFRYPASPVFGQIVKITIQTWHLENYLHVSNAPINVKPQRGGGGGHRWGIWFFEQIFNQMPHRRAINIGQIPHYFAINCNKYYINKVIWFKSPQLGAKMLIKIPRVGMQLMIKYPTYSPPPPLLGLTLIGA
jgi:hypothetical protein